jgi:hypothetical protein
MNETKLPSFFPKIKKDFFDKVAKIILFLLESGMELESGWIYRPNKGYKDIFEQLMKQTTFDLHFAHANDFIECGGSIEDKEGKLFSVWSDAVIPVHFPGAKMEEIFNILDSFSDGKLPYNKYIPSVELSFYSWERNIKASSYHKGHIEMDLKFKVYYKF